MIGQQVDDRKRYGRFDKREILTRTGGICACCGKKLNVDTMTVEHVIPISRGGFDSIRNTIALCEQCNKDKGNMLYLPTWFYTAICGTELQKELTDMFAEWFRKVKDEFPVEFYPLVAPRNNLLLDITPFRPNTPSKRRNKATYIRGNVLQWHYTGKDYVAEVEACTNVNVRRLRNAVAPLMGGDNYPVAVYTCRKLTTDKILCVVACAIDVKREMATIRFEWSELPRKYKPSVYYSFVRLLFNVHQLTEYRIRHVLLIMGKSDRDVAMEIQQNHLQSLACDLGIQVHARTIELEREDEQETHGIMMEIQIKNMPLATCRPTGDKTPSKGIK